MERLVAEYIALLQTDKSASAKFWELENRIKQEKTSPGVIMNKNLYPPFEMGAEAKP